MDGFPSKARRAPIYVLAAVLWLASAVLGLAAVYYLRELSLLIYALIGGSDFYRGVLISQVITVIAGLLWVVVIVGTGEYHLKHSGEQKSWTVFAWTIGIEILIIGLAFLLRLA